MASSKHDRRRAALSCLALALWIFTATLTGCAVGQSKPPVTTEQIVQMSKEGVPPADIIQKMRDAGTIYRLPASRLAVLKSEGVPDEVLDYMQDTYLAQERARGAMDYGYYWNSPWGWGPGPYPYNYWGPRGYWGPYWGPYWGYPYPYRPRPVPRPAPKPPAPSALPSPPGTLPSPAAPRPGLPRRGAGNQDARGAATTTPLRPPAFAR